METKGGSDSWHRITGVDEATRHATCSKCGPNTEVSRLGGRWTCKTAFTPILRRSRARSQVQHRGPVCERCGFEPEHESQLDVDHVIPRSKGGSDDLSNLMTLCANCHRLKTWVERKPWHPRAVELAPSFRLPVPEVGVA